MPRSVVTTSPMVAGSPPSFGRWETPGGHSVLRMSRMRKRAMSHIPSRYPSTVGPAITNRENQCQLRK